MSVSILAHTGGAARAGTPVRQALAARRAPRHVLVGIALIVVFSLSFGLLALRADPATPVLAVARPVAAGQTIIDADLEVVRLVPDAGIDVIPDIERSTVVGHTAVVPLVTGSLLSSDQVGTAAWPPAGEAVIAVPVAEGRLPSGLSTGSRVMVMTPTAPQAAGAPGTPAGPLAVSATVVAVEPPTVAGVTTVSLLLPSTQARQVASPAGEVVLVLESPDGGR